MMARQQGFNPVLRSNQHLGRFVIEGEATVDCWEQAVPLIN